MTRCDDGEQNTGLLQINTCRRTVESKEGVLCEHPFHLSYLPVYILHMSLRFFRRRVGRDVFKLMGRLIGLALCEKIPLGIPMASGFFKQLEADSIFPEIVSLVSV